MSNMIYSVQFENCGQHGMVNVLPMYIENLTPIWDERDMCAWVGQIAGECYGSSTDVDKCVTRALNCIKRGHHSPWEHVNITLKCLMDRGTSHAIVRHRHCAFQQSSTIYQNMTRDGVLNVIGLPKQDPCNGDIVPEISEEELHLYNELALRYQKQTNDMKQAPERARDLVPTCLATNLIITTNISEWMYIIHRRNGPGDAVRTHCFCKLLTDWFNTHYPRITMLFDEWYESGRKM